MGDKEAAFSGAAESTLGYHSSVAAILTENRETGFGTLSGGQFDWGGRLLKSNGGAQRFPHVGWKPTNECNGRRELNCETYKSSRCESRA